jgi:hypothetical protein
MTLTYETDRDLDEDAMRYRRHGEPHRIGGPASMWFDGDIRYAQYGALHRIDGSVYSIYDKIYYIRGKRISKYDFYWRRITQHVAKIGSVIQRITRI